MQASAMHSPMLLYIGRAACARGGGARGARAAGARPRGMQRGARRRRRHGRQPLACIGRETCACDNNNMHVPGARSKACSSSRSAAHVHAPCPGLEAHRGDGAPAAGSCALGRGGRQGARRTLVGRVSWATGGKRDHTSAACWATHILLELAPVLEPSPTQGCRYPHCRAPAVLVWKALHSPVPACMTTTAPSHVPPFRRAH